MSISRQNSRSEPSGRFHSEGNYVAFTAEVARMYLGDSDNRAVKIAEKHGFTQRQLFRTWASLIRSTSPRTIMDIGANYGEMSLPLVLGPGSEIHAFEPAPLLADALERSVSTHLQASAFRVIRSAVSDRSGTHTFNVDRKWSGTSSLDFQRADSRFKGEGAQEFDVIEVPTVTLDDYAMERLALPHEGTLALKVDVEGHEPRVFRGGSKLLRGTDFFAIFEFSASQLKLAGFEPEPFLAELAQLGELYARDEAEALELVTAAEAAEVRHGDLVLSNIPSLPQAVMPR